MSFSIHSHHLRVLHQHRWAHPLVRLTSNCHRHESTRPESAVSHAQPYYTYLRYGIAWMQWIAPGGGGNRSSLRIDNI
jgi:hypothetical protein